MAEVGRPVPNRRAIQAHVLSRREKKANKIISSSGSSSPAKCLAPTLTTALTTQSVFSGTFSLDSAAGRRTEGEKQETTKNSERKRSLLIDTVSQCWRYNRLAKKKITLYSITAASVQRIYPHRVVDESKLGGTTGTHCVQYQNAARERKREREGL